MYTQKIFNFSLHIKGYIHLIPTELISSKSTQITKTQYDILPKRNVNFPIKIKLFKDFSSIYQSYFNVIKLYMNEETQ